MPRQIKTQFAVQRLPAHKIAADKTEIICLMSAGYTALDSICEQSLDEHSLESMNEAPGVAERRNL